MSFLDDITNGGLKFLAGVQSLLPKQIQTPQAVTKTANDAVNWATNVTQGPADRLRALVQNPGFYFDTAPRQSIHDALTSLGFQSSTRSGKVPALRDVPSLAVKSIKPSMYAIGQAGKPVADFANPENLMKVPGVSNVIQGVGDTVNKVPVVGPFANDVVKWIANTPHAYLQRGVDFFQKPNVKTLAGLTGAAVDLAMSGLIPEGLLAAEGIGKAAIEDGVKQATSLGGKQLYEQGFKKIFLPLVGQQAYRYGLPMAISSALQGFADNKPVDQIIKDAGITFATVTGLGTAAPVGSAVIRHIINNQGFQGAVSSLSSHLANIMSDQSGFIKIPGPGGKESILPPELENIARQYGIQPEKVNPQYHDELVKTLQDIKAQREAVLGTTNLGHEPAVPEGSGTSVPLNKMSNGKPALTQAEDALSNLSATKDLPSSETLKVSPSNLTNLGKNGVGIKSPEFRTQLSQLYTKVRDNASNFEQSVKSVADSVGGKAEVNVKEPLTAAEKIARKQTTKPGYSLNDIADTLRARVNVKSEGDVAKTVDAIKAKFGDATVEDHFARPTPMGFRGVNINVTMPDGLKTEIQVHTPESAALLNELHPIYEKYRFNPEPPTEAYVKSLETAGKYFKLTVPEQAYLDTVKNGGVTISKEGIKPTEGYAYAPNKGTEYVVPETKFTPEEVYKYFDKMQADLNKPGNNLGIWVEDGKIYQDVSRVGPANSATLADAAKADQLAVYDLKKGETVYTNEKANSASLNQGENQGASSSGGNGSLPKVPAGESPFNKGPVREVKNLVAPSSLSKAAEITAQQIREAKAKIANFTDVLAAKGKPFQKAFEKFKNSENIGSISEYERTGNFGDKAPAGYGKIFKESMDWSRSTLQQAYGKDRVGYIENYVRRMFKFGSAADEAKATKFLGDNYFSLSASKSPLKGRVLHMPLDEALQNMKDRGIKVEPVTTNPEVLRQWSIKNAQRALTYADTWKTWKKTGQIQFVRMGSSAPEGMVRLNDNAAKVMFPAEQGMVQAGQYYADKNVAQVINNSISRGLESSPTFKGIREIENTLNQFQLGFSAFHLTGTAINASISDIANGMRDIFSGHPIQGVGSLVRGLAPGVSLVADTLKGRNLIEGLKNNSPEAYKILEEKLNPAGGRLSLDRQYRLTAYQNMVDNFKKGTPAGIFKGMAQAPMAIPSKIIESVASPLMQYTIPRAKIGAFLDTASRDLAKLPADATEQMRKQALTEAWDSIDNRFGQLVYDNLFWNKAAKDLTMVATRSLGWNFGTIRELGGGITDVFTKTMRGKGVSDKTLYTIALPIYVGTLGAVYQYLHTGKRPESLLDYFYPKTGLVNQGGNDERISLPTYMKDVFAYLNDPFATVSHKSSPILDIAISLATNKNYYGDMVRNPDDTKGQQLQQMGSYVMQTILPFTIQQSQRDLKAGASAEQIMERFFGFTIAPGSVTKSSGEQIVDNLLKTQLNSGPATPEQQNIIKQKADARTQIQQGMGTALLDQLVASGIIKPKSRQDFIDRSKMTSFQRSFESLSYINQLKALSMMDATSRAKLGDFMSLMHSPPAGSY